VILKRDQGDMPEKSKAISGSGHRSSTVHVGTINPVGRLVGMKLGIKLTVTFPDLLKIKVEGIQRSLHTRIHVIDAGL
jgi:hypothetical protein